MSFIRRSSFILLPSSFVLIALAGGLLIARLPLTYSAALIIGICLAVASIWEPAIGLGCALLLGPTRAYLAALGFYGPLYDLGQIFFALALAGWLARSARERRLVIPPLRLFIPLGAFVFIGLLSLLGAAEWRDGVNEIIKWLEMAVVILIALDAARRGRAGWLIAALLLTGLTQAGLGLWQHAWRGAGPESFQLPGGLYRAYGTFEQPNPFGGFLGLIWPVAAALGVTLLAKILRPKKVEGKNWRLFILLPSSLLLLVGLYVSFSRGAWLGAAAAGLVLALFWPRRLGLGLSLVLIGLVTGYGLLQAGLVPASISARLANITDFVTVSDVRGININDANYALVERLAHWQAALDMARDYPWLGVGLGNYVTAYAQYHMLNWPASLGHAHNIYLHTLAETGALGLAAYVTFWGAVVALTVRTLRRTSGWQRGLALGLLGVWAHLLTHQIVDNLHVNNNDLLLAVELGLLCWLAYPKMNAAPLRTIETSK